MTAVVRPSFVAVALFAVGVSLSACSGNESTNAPAEKSAAISGEQLRLAPSTVTDWKDVGALVTSIDMADARARISGILDSLTVREGDMVRKGQVIGRIVDSRLSYEGAAFGAQAAAAQAQAAQAEAELARVKYLHANGVYAQARLDQAEAGARAARAQVNAARAQQSAVGAVAGQGVLVAPSAGRVLVAPIPAGSAVAPGTSIATITSGAMVLRLELPETLGDKVRVGSAVIATGLANDAAPIAPRATVSRVYPSITGGQMSADVQIPGLPSQMVGRRVTARIAVGERQALVVPRRFVETSYGTDYVTIRVGRDATSRVPVQIAPSDDPARVEILSGAAAGDMLIAAQAGMPK